jgi:hypothetical protein
MSPLFTYKGKLLVVDGKLAAGPDCCCGCPEPVAFGMVENPLINFGWTKPPTKKARSITATFTFEDSINCGLRTNPNTQRGSGECSFTLSENTQVTLRVDGNTEDHTPGFDYGWILITGPGVPPSKQIGGANYHVLIGSTENDNRCQMFNKNDQVQMNIGPGRYTVFFNVNTIDPEFHQNMVHNFSVTW